MKYQPKNRRSEAVNQEMMRNDAASAQDLTRESAGDNEKATGPGGFSDEAVQEQDLSIVGPESIQPGDGLDEAELARKKPLDGKPWDGDPHEPYGSD